MSYWVTIGFVCKDSVFDIARNIENASPHDN